MHCLQCPLKSVGHDGSPCTIDTTNPIVLSSSQDKESEEGWTGLTDPFPFCHGLQSSWELQGSDTPPSSRFMQPLCFLCRSQSSGTLLHFRQNQLFWGGEPLHISDAQRWWNAVLKEGGHKRHNRQAGEKVRGNNRKQQELQGERGGGASYVPV
ncbi:unnamed protein product [Caretta caretta]